MYTFAHAVAIGRFVMGLFWLTNPPEIYTAAIGLYSLWLIIRVSTSLYSYVTEGAVQLMTQVAFWGVQALKCAVAGFLLFVVVPLLLGHLVDLFLLSPLRVPTDRTPIFYASTVSEVACVCVFVLSYAEGMQLLNVQHVHVNFDILVSNLLVLHVNK